MTRNKNFYVILLVALVAFTFSACDTTADRELKRAERALDEALHFNADAHAPDDYIEAENLLQDAMELSRNKRIQEAREAAVKAKLRADDARRKAEERMRILDDESRRLGR